jgi:hypothetical protein
MAEAALGQTLGTFLRMPGEVSLGGGRKRFKNPCPQVQPNTNVAYKQSIGRKNSEVFRSAFPRPAPSVFSANALEISGENIVKLYSGYHIL